MSEQPGGSQVRGSAYMMVEALPKILPHVCHSDLRRLRFLNHEIYMLVVAYRRQFERGLTNLPNEIILEAIQYLCARDKSRLARASHRFYPLIMDSIIRDNIRYDRSNLLLFSVAKNLKSLTRRMICTGGNVNTTAAYMRRSAVLWRPLSIAAYYGYEDMVKLLLGFGASPSGQGEDMPLELAIKKRHERVALILLESLGSMNGNSHITGGKLLQMAVAARMVTLVSHLLERKSEFHARDIDTALYHVLLGDIENERFLKRALHPEVYHIVLMLLENGADPDVQPTGKVEAALITARLLSSRHPDPRVRALLLDTMSISCLRESVESDSRNDSRSCVVTSGAEGTAPKLSQSSDWFADRLLFARLGDFLRTSNDDHPLAVEDQGVTNDQITHDEGMHNTNCASTTFDLEAVLATTRQSILSEGSVRAKVLPDSAFPQLGRLMESTQQAAQGIWATPNSRVHSPFSSPVCTLSATTTRLVPRKSAPPPERFPQLATPSQRSSDIKSGMWTNISKSQSNRKTEAVGCTFAGMDEMGDNKPSAKSQNSKKKKAKWVPLSL